MSIVKAALQLTATFVSGALLGALVWHLSVHYGHIGQDTLYFIVRRIGKPIGAVLSNKDAVEQLTIMIIIAVRNFYGIVAFGVLAGLVLRWIKYRRFFIWSTLFWPLYFYALGVYVAYVYDHPSLDRAAFFRTANFEFARGALVIYGSFFLVTLLVYKLAVAVRPKQEKQRAVLDAIE